MNVLSHWLLCSLPDGFFFNRWVNPAVRMSGDVLGQNTWIIFAQQVNSICGSKVLWSGCSLFSLLLVPEYLPVVLSASVSFYKNFMSILCPTAVFSWPRCFGVCVFVCHLWNALLEYARLCGKVSQRRLRCCVLSWLSALDPEAKMILLSWTVTVLS